MKKGEWTEEEKKEYLEKASLLQSKTSKILKRLIALDRNELTEKNFTEYIKENSKLKKEFGMYY